MGFYGDEWDLNKNHFLHKCVRGKRCDFMGMNGVSTNENGGYELGLPSANVCGNYGKSPRVKTVNHRTRWPIGP